MPLKDWRKLFVPKPVAGLADYCLRTDSLVGGNKLELLRDGREAYPAMLAAIESAKSYIHLETYILRDGMTARRFAHSLADRARAGVPVRLIYDSVGSLKLSGTYIQHLRNSGIQLLEYRPVEPWRRRWGWDRRDHRKILVVDGRVAFTGGINIADDYADPAEGGGGWHDVHVRVEGPAAHELDRLFRALWSAETGRWVRLDGPAGPVGKSHVHVAANQEFLHRFLIRRAILHAIANASRRIVIANAYFIPDGGMRKALYQARARGVQVDILVPSVSDVPAVQYASRRLYARHLARGLRLHAWPGPVLHAKAMVVDRSWCAVGSYNFTHRSLHHNLEVNLHVLDAEFAGRLEDSILEDLRGSGPILAEEWARRRFSEKFLEAICYPCRHWF